MNRISQRERPKIVSNAIVLDSASQNKLKDAFPGVHDKRSGDHVTLDYGIDEYHEDFGKTVPVTVVGYARDDKGEAVEVSISGVRCDNSHPHITISTAPGVGAVYSNELLANGYEKISPMTLSGTVGSYIRGKYVTKKV